MPRKKYCNVSCSTKALLPTRSLSRLGKAGSERQKEVMRARKGELHPLWIKDRTQVKRRFKESLSTFQYQEWRTRVFTRDNFKCRMLNTECSGTYLEAHHILRLRDYPELSYDINNGITLCKFHHPLGKEKETKLMPYLLSLLTQS